MRAAVAVARRRPMTHADLDVNVRSLHSVGGLYELIAQVVEHHERPHCTSEPTNVAPPWYVA